MHVSLKIILYDHVRCIAVFIHVQNGLEKHYCEYTYVDAFIAKNESFFMKLTKLK